jgi:cell division protein FtsZ
VSISVATVSLTNINGGEDLTLGEVHQINEIIHDAVGDDAEIIFGAVHEPAMQGEIRVTVIATGFDRPSVAAAQTVTDSKGAPVIPFPSARQRAGGIRPASGAADVRRLPNALPGLADKTPGQVQDLSDMEIPTFIRRQMD